MENTVFFSCHYEEVNDFRVEVIKNCEGIKDISSFVDPVAWRVAKKSGEISLRALVTAEIVGSTVTAVLISENTFHREWIRYEIAKSVEKGNKLIGIHLNHIKDINSETLALGKNPFDYLGLCKNTNGRVNLIEKSETDHRWRWYPRLDVGIISSIYVYRYDVMPLSDVVPVYDWEKQDGYNNFGTWIENAVKV
ncbi:MAG: TIR domain-containing protein [Candidatus Kapabacteria bacterium]|nr:TIR domain-containing protein [Candidatus Kapabacteria bacterium]